MMMTPNESLQPMPRIGPVSINASNAARPRLVVGPLAIL